MNITKVQQAINKLTDEVEKVLNASIINTEASYNKQQKSWCVKAIFSFEDHIEVNDLINKFSKVGLNISPSKLKYPHRFSITKMYKE
jgi:histidinol dehydrogenase